MTYHEHVSKFKAELIARTIMECEGVRALAAERLGLDRNYLARLVREMNIKVPPAIPGGAGLVRAREIRARLAATNGRPH